MLALLSPAKTLDYSTPLTTRKHSEPRLLGHTQALIDVMRTKSVADLAAMMSTRVSPPSCTSMLAMS